MCPARNAARRGFTLIELLVVVGIIVLLTVLGYFLLPPLASDYNRVRSLDLISECLLSAKMRAKRDGLPTGVRLIVDTASPVGPPAQYWVRQLQYIQQPEPLTANSVATGITGVITGATATTPITITSTNHGLATGAAVTISLVGGNTAANGSWLITVVNANQFTLNGSAGNAAWTSGGIWTAPGLLGLISSGAASFTGTDFVGAGTSAGAADASVQPGDYLELLGGGSVYQIGTVSSASSLTLVNTSVSYGAAPTTSWRIQRQPRALPGEDVKQLPAEYIIDLGLSLNAPIPPKTIAYPSGSISVLDIVFSPSGSLVGLSTQGKLVLYVRDTTTTGTRGPDGLIAVNVRTGFIGAYDVAPGANPYLFTQDGRSGGL
jgi:prepilin-type N-terminal cleavage/methylation domain-containing protein